MIMFYINKKKIRAEGFFAFARHTGLASLVSNMVHRSDLMREGWPVYVFCKTIDKYPMGVYNQAKDRNGR